MSSSVILIGRILLALIFIMSGFGKLADIAGTAGYFASLNLPAPGLLAVLAGIVELAGGILVLVGLQTRIAAYGLAAFAVASALVAHTDFSDMMQVISFQKNLAIAGGFLVLAAFGPGWLSMDGRRGVSHA